MPGPMRRPGQLPDLQFATWADVEGDSLPVLLRELEQHSTAGAAALNGAHALCKSHVRDIEDIVKHVRLVASTSGTTLLCVFLAALSLADDRKRKNAKEKELAVTKVRPQC
jgi:hypothetical protein